MTDVINASDRYFVEVDDVMTSERFDELYFIICLRLLLCLSILIRHSYKWHKQIAIQCTTAQTYRPTKQETKPHIGAFTETHTPTIVGRTS